ncbi:hypothetical protein TPY_2335 [Sulfobacillus acidophilus TPY]|nr:hypothetical protein TPY_2335 [Sulfobacillus acidophilus TPY]
MTTLDTYARQDLKGCLQALADVTERYGFDLAIQALENAVQHHQIAYPDILVRAARMAEWPYPEAQTVDLRTYNVLIPSREMEVSP